MAFSWGDGFDCYASTSDATNGYWDSGTSTWQITTGRFAGSRALSGNGVAVYLAKSSGANDAVHHFAVSHQQILAISGSSLYLYLQLVDGTTGQCAVVFRSDGAILLTSGTSGGAVLAAYPNAYTVMNTWNHFEIEVVIHSTAGSFSVRKNGNPVADFSQTGLNTRGGTANDYANKLQLGSATNSGACVFDDLFWRSDATAVAWMGEIRCITRYPASDASVQFSKVGSRTVSTSGGGGTSATPNTAIYSPVTFNYGGTLTEVLLNFFGSPNYTGSTKCALFNDASGQPGTVLATAANIITNPANGYLPFNFSGVTVSIGQKLWVGINCDTSALYWVMTSGSAGWRGTSPPYASFPQPSPTGLTSGGTLSCQFTIAPNNASCVNEPQQDILTSYVYSNTPGHADFYGLDPIAPAPFITIAVVTRAFMTKPDAGMRTAALRLKSGGTTVVSPTLTLTTSNWTWAWRTDTVDPNTGAAWTAGAVNSAQVGPVVVA